MPDVRAVVGERRVDLLPDLVAAGARPGTDRGLDRAVDAQLAERLHPLGHDPAGQPPPAGVKHRHRALPATAIGRQSAVITIGARSRQRRRLPVGLGQLDALVRERRHTSPESVPIVRTDVPWTWRMKRGRDPDLVVEPGAVALDRLGPVGGQPPRFRLA